MKELLYTEVPTPDLKAVKVWLQNTWQPISGKKTTTPDGIRLHFDSLGSELSIFVWQLQRTTYLKIFQWGDKFIAAAKGIQQQLLQAIRQAFPPKYPVPPRIDLSNQSIFEALADSYPETVRFFQKMPNQLKGLLFLLELVAPFTSIFSDAFSSSKKKFFYHSQKI